MDTLRPQIHWPKEEVGRAHNKVDNSKPRSYAGEAALEALLAASVDGDLNVLHPFETSVSVRVFDLAAEITVTLCFKNLTNSIIQKGFFSFPFPSGSSLTRFRFFIGEDKVIHSKAKPNTTAFADFEGAVHNSKAAALIKQDTPEIFTAGLGNLPPQTALRAEVSLVTILKEKISDEDKGLTCISTLTIPTYIAPRYGTLPAGYLNATTPGLQSQHAISVAVKAVFADKVINVVSKTHNISYKVQPGSRPCRDWNDFARAESPRDPSYSVTVALENPAVLADGDFVVDFVTRPEKGPLPRAYVEKHSSLPGHHAVMLTIPSTILFDRRHSLDDSEILFLADRSGSMCDKIEALKSAVVFFLKGISPGERFNIWSFGSECSSLWPRSRAKSQDTLSEALDHVEDEFYPDLGGTELLPALKAIFGSRPSTTSSTTDIILLTDGEVWHQEETIEFVKSARKHSGYRVRFFCLGIGSAVSHSLVEGIAQAGGGYAEVVPAKQTNKGWEDRVVSMLRASRHTHIGPVKLEIGEETTHGFKPWNRAVTPFLQTPTDASLSNPFVTKRVLMLFEETGLPVHRAIIQLKTMRPSGGEEIRTILPSVIKNNDTILHTIAARELLNDLEQGRHWLDYASEHSVRREGERIACKWSLLSKWTCLVAVEESTKPLASDLPADIQASISSLCRVTSRTWDPDLLRPVKTSKTISGFQKHNTIDTGSESESEDDTEEEKNVDEEFAWGPRQPKGDDPDGAGGPSASGSSGPNPPSGPSGSGARDGQQQRGNQQQQRGSQNSFGANSSYSSKLLRSSKDETFSGLTIERLQSIINSLGWPESLPDDHSQTKGRTIERDCSILAPNDFESTPDGEILWVWGPRKRTRPLAPWDSQPLPTAIHRDASLDEGLSLDEDSPQYFQDFPSSEDEEVELDKRDVIRSLVNFQAYNGSFSSMQRPQSELVNMFGEGVRPALDRISDKIAFLLWSKQSSPKTRDEYEQVALNALIIALLRLHFRSLRSFSYLMLENAEGFVSSWTAQRLPDMSGEDVIQVAYEVVQSIEVNVRRRSGNDFTRRLRRGLVGAAQQSWSQSPATRDSRNATRNSRHPTSRRSGVAIHGSYSSRERILFETRASSPRSMAIGSLPSPHYIEDFNMYGNEGPAMHSNEDFTAYVAPYGGQVLAMDRYADDPMYDNEDPAGDSNQGLGTGGNEGLAYSRADASTSTPAYGTSF